MVGEPEGLAIPYNECLKATVAVKEAVIENRYLRFGSRYERAIQIDN